MKAPQQTISQNNNGDIGHDNCDLSAAVHRALVSSDRSLGQYFALLAIGGSLSTLLGCSALPLQAISNDPSMVVAMVSESPAAVNAGKTNPGLPNPQQRVEMPVDRRPEVLPAEPDTDDADNVAPLEPESIAKPSQRLELAPIVESEVVGWRLNGTRLWQRLNILDMEVVNDDNGKRYLPLLRILRILDIEHRTDDDIASFYLPGEPEIRINIATSTAWIADRKHTLVLIPGTSDITGQPEVFVSAADMQLLLPIHLAWDDINYEFKGTTNHVFAVWERRSNEHSLLFANANLVGMDLPNLLDTAEPSQHKLSFMEVQWNSRFSTGESSDSELTVGTAPTVWGNLLGGRYKVAMSNTEFNLNSSGSANTPSRKFVPSQVEWTRSNSTSELVVGDSSFGLHDLAFPLARYSGIRFNGLIGTSAAELENDVSSRGLHRRFYRPHIFEGYAPVGSEVRLEMNGNIIATQRVLEEANPVSGMGIFRFEDIALSTSSLSNIRAVITDINGVETEIEREMIGAPQMLPAGRLSYVGGFGTSRTGLDWGTSGALLATRFLYGLNDRLSLGTSFASQSGFFDLTNSTDGNDRTYPDTSRHAVAEFVSLPLSNLTLSGDAAVSTGSDSTDPSSFEGTAYRLRAKYYPTNELQLGSQLFNYGPGYFDGRNRELENKTGYTVDAQWRPVPKWSVRGAIGAVDQIKSKSRFFAPRTASYQQLQVNTSVLPRTNLTLSLDQNNLSWENPKTLAGIRSRTRFRNGMNLRIDASFGDELSPQGDQDYFQGLALPGLRRIGSDNLYLALDKQLNSIHRLGLELRESHNTQKLSAVHTFETARLRMSSKLGYDIESDQPAWEGWWDMPFNDRGRDRLSLVTRFERGEWRADLSLYVVSLFENDRGKIGRIPGDRFYAHRGGVKGRVFVDINGDGILDAGEPGIPNIEVFGERSTKTTTDVDGKFYLPVVAAKAKMQVALNVDSVPATYSVVHGKQNAAVGPGGSTEVNLALTPLVTVSGQILVQAAEPDATAIAEYRRQLAAAPDEKLSEEPEFDYKPDNVIVLSTATRISPPSNEFDLADAGQTTETAGDLAINAENLNETKTQVADVILPVELPDTAAVAEFESEPVVVAEVIEEAETQVAEVILPVELPATVPVAEFESEPVVVAELADETEIQIAEFLPVELPDTVPVAEFKSAPVIVAEVIEEADTQIAEVIQPVELPDTVAVAEFESEPVIVAEVIEEAETQVIEILAPIDLTDTVWVSEFDTDPIIDAEFVDETEMQAIEVLPQAEFPAETRMAEIDAEKDVGLSEVATLVENLHEGPDNLTNASSQANSLQYVVLPEVNFINIVEFIPEQPADSNVLSVAEIHTPDTFSELEAITEESLPEIIESVPLEESVVAAAIPEPEAPTEESLPEIIESIPLEEPVVVVAAATPEPEVVAEPALPEMIEEPVLADAKPEPETMPEELLPEIIESVPLEESVVAAAIPEPEAPTEESLPEIIESIPFEEPVVAAVTPEPEVVTEPALPEILEPVAIEEPVLADAMPEPNTVPEESLPEIIESIPFEEPVVAVTTVLADAIPEPDAVTGGSLPEIIESIPFEETAVAATTPELEASTEESPEDETLMPGYRIARAMELHRQTLLQMSTTLTHDIEPTDQIARPNPALSLAMSRRIESPLIDDPKIRLAEIEASPASATSHADGSVDLQLSRSLSETGDDLDAKVTTPETRPVALRMAQTLKAPPADQREQLAQTERDRILAKAEETRASGMKLSRALSLQRQPLQKKAISGVRVVMRDTRDHVVADSVTAADGSFYLSNLRPGSYTLEVDPTTIPEGYIVLEMSKTIEIFQGQDFQEIEIPPIYAIADLDKSVLR